MNSTLVLPSTDIFAVPRNKIRIHLGSHLYTSIYLYIGRPRLGGEMVSVED